MEKWTPKWEFWPFFRFGGHFSAICVGRFSIAFPFSWDLCVLQVSHSVNGIRSSESKKSLFDHWLGTLPPSRTAKRRFHSSESKNTSPIFVRHFFKEIPSFSLWGDPLQIPRRTPAPETLAFPPGNARVSRSQEGEGGFRNRARKRGHYERGLFTGGISRISRISRKWSDSPLFSTVWRFSRSLESLILESLENGFF